MQECCGKCECKDCAVACFDCKSGDERKCEETTECRNKALKERK